MAYQRFLTDNDYLALITEEGLNSLTRGNTDRLAQAEQRAEMRIVDYLDQFYEIGAVLEVGKRIKDYSPLITYPSNVFFKKDGKIWRTAKAMNACHRPNDKVYWEKAVDLTLPAEQLRETNREVLPYLQQKTYKPGDVVEYLGITWQCLIANGWDFKNIQIPGIDYWEKIVVDGWEANIHYHVGDVVAYDGQFYMVVADDESEREYYEDGTPTIPENIDWSEDPEISPAYGLIGDYAEDYNYNLDGNDYVVYENEVWRPTMNPNADEPVENENIVQDDPRNYNLVNYMTAIALYYLNALIAPTNVPLTRETMFNEAMDWVEAASRLRLDPHIPRKIDKDKKCPKDDWALASFETNQETQVNSPWFT